MRSVSIRELRAYLKQELDDLPFAVTNRGVVVGVMCTQESFSSTSVHKNVEKEAPSVHKGEPSKGDVIKEVKGKIAATKIPEEAGLTARQKYRFNNPREWCSMCNNFNKDCVCDEVINGRRK